MDHVWKASQQCEETSMYCTRLLVGLHNDGGCNDGASKDRELRYSPHS